MHRLRRKIEQPARPAAIQTVRGEGYIIRDEA
jgi:DNA-binding response OmpR family regulator